MPCKETQQKLAVGIPLTSDEKRHLVECDQCRLMSEDAALIKSKIESLPDPRAPHHLYDSIKTSLQQGSPRQAFNWRGSLMVVPIIAVLGLPLGKIVFDRWAASSGQPSGFLVITERPRGSDAPLSRKSLEWFGPKASRTLLFGEEFSRIVYDIQYVEAELAKAKADESRTKIKWKFPATPPSGKAEKLGASSGNGKEGSGADLGVEYTIDTQIALEKESERRNRLIESQVNFKIALDRTMAEADHKNSRWLTDPAPNQALGESFGSDTLIKQESDGIWKYEKNTSKGSYVRTRATELPKTWTTLASEWLKPFQTEDTVRIIGAKTVIEGQSVIPETRTRKGYSERLVILTDSITLKPRRYTWEYKVDTKLSLRMESSDLSGEGTWVPFRRADFIERADSPNLDQLDVKPLTKAP